MAEGMEVEALKEIEVEALTEIEVEVEAEATCRTRPRWSPGRRGSNQ